MAYRKLAAKSQQIEPQLISIRDSTSSLEVRQKAQQLLDEQYQPNLENVRIVRVIEVVERIALDKSIGAAFPSQARTALTRWASGTAGETLTEEAKHAIDRIKKLASTD